MSRWTTAGLTVAVLLGLGVGAALSPVARGQDRARARADAGRAFQLIMGGGARIGVSVRDVGDDDVKRAKLQGPGGVVVEDVRSDSPAEKAGLKDGDVVIEFDGERVRSTRQFARLVQETAPDRQVQAIVVRDGQRVTLSIEPASGRGFSYFGDLEGLEKFRVPPTPPVPPAAPAPPAAPFPEFDIERFFGSAGGRLGVTVNELPSQLAEYFGAKDGVLVTSVSADSVAAKSGLKAGDVITAIDDTTVSSAADLRRRTQRLEDGDEFTLSIVRDKKTMTLKGKMEGRRSARWTTAVL